ncbi:uncharacterized protein METZ01_LOCUS201684 [marine metagenome]|uniref:Uncharacterized protein n=1 Tax=marine metagenome TaxID=408172 RepID=A0A382EDU4_9ZZZZ
MGSPARVTAKTNDKFGEAANHVIPEKVPRK